MRTIEEIQAEMLQYKKYEDVPKELRTEYNKISLQTIQQEEDERYKREHITRDIPLDRLEQICNAECDGRLVVSPCKVGDTVWFTELEYCSSDTHFPQKAKIYSVWKDKTHNWNFNCSSGKKREFQGFNVDNFGKTVFLTKAEAEKALKGGAE